jgi:endo-1,4-beta-xylanase
LRPQSETHASIKDPTIVRYNDRWHVIATVFDRTADTYNMVHTSFGDWSEALTASQTYLGTASPGLSGYNCAPQLFYFEPKALWYLVYQGDNNFPKYSTNSDLADPTGWTAPANFYASEPAIVTQNKGSGFWIDFWVICDEANCYMFFSDDNGHYYRAATTLGQFPAGFGTPEIILQDDRSELFEASNVYKVSGTNQYLLLIEAMSNSRWFRAWTATSLSGEWTPLADSQANPFASKDNVTFEGQAWSGQVSHGELIRDGYDQSLSISACDLTFLYQGIDPTVTQESVGGYNYLPYRLGLLTLKP